MLEAVSNLALFVGLNEALGQVPLSFAEKDARDLYRVWVGGQGLSSDMEATLLVGTEASVEAVEGWLSWARAQGPDTVTIYLSTHGDDAGVALANGFLFYNRFAQLLRAVRARSTLLIVDACSAASLRPRLQHDGIAGGFELVVGLRLLASTVPGLRAMFSTGRGRVAGEGRTVDNGHFTSSLLHVLKTSKGDLWASGVGFLSDRQAFDLANRMTTFRFGQRAEQIGLRGDLPLVVSQGDSVIGSGSVCAVRAAPGGVAVRVATCERRFVATVIRIVLANSAGRPLFETTNRVVPTHDMAVLERLTSWPLAHVLGDPRSRLEIQRLGHARVVWMVRLEDVFGRVLDETHAAIPVVTTPDLFFRLVA
jgi:hypothetical protein